MRRTKNSHRAVTAMLVVAGIGSGYFAGTLHDDIERPIDSSADETDRKSLDVSRDVETEVAGSLELPANANNTVLPDRLVEPIATGELVLLSAIADDDRAVSLAPTPAGSPVRRLLSASQPAEDALSDAAIFAPPLPENFRMTGNGVIEIVAAADAGFPGDGIETASLDPPNAALITPARADTSGSADDFLAETGNPDAPANLADEAGVGERATSAATYPDFVAILDPPELEAIAQLGRRSPKPSWDVGFDSHEAAKPAWQSVSGGVIDLTMGDTLAPPIIADEGIGAAALAIGNSGTSQSAGPCLSGIASACNPDGISDGIAMRGTGLSMPVIIAGQAKGDVAVIIDRHDNILVSLAPLLEAVRDRLDPAVYERLARTAASRQYVDIEKMRSAGFMITFDNRLDGPVLTLR